jgi:MSHA biogenesis protein MshK
VFERLAIAVWLLASAASHAAEPPPRDPMRPYEAPPGGPGAVHEPRFRLTSVLISPSRRIAVINGKSYREGETVGGAALIRVDAKSIALRDGSLEIVVPLGEPQPRAAGSRGDSAR